MLNFRLQNNAHERISEHFQKNKEVKISEIGFEVTDWSVVHGKNMKGNYFSIRISAVAF